MLRGKFLSLILMVTAFLGVAIWSVWNYDRAFNAVTRYTQLSAWALARWSWKSVALMRRSLSIAPVRPVRKR